MSNVQLKVKRELFSFSSKQDWINKAQTRFLNCEVKQGNYICIDSLGYAMRIGKQFMEAEERNSYPVTVYELD